MNKTAAEVQNETTAANDLQAVQQLEAACAKIKADVGLSGVKLVIITALKNFAFQHEARNSGADVVLEKPVSWETLKKTLDRLFPGP